MRSLLIAALGCAIAFGAAAAEEHGAERHYAPLVPVDKHAFFTGNTVNAVAYIKLDRPSRSPNSGGVGLSKRVMFQAFLEPRGDALVRWWDTSADRYSRVSTQRWRLDGDTLCLAVPAFATADEQACFVVNVWGPNFSGYSTDGRGLIKGDVSPGNGLAG